MPTLTINGQTCEFEGKKSILEVALENQVEVPHYCYHPGLSVVASCRICLAEVAAPNPRNEGKVELIPKLVPTCQTPAAQGQEVYTQSPKSIANQKAVMEFLLINHPLDCPVCDQAGECSLQDYSYRYGHGASRFEEDKIKQPKKNLGEHVLLYSDRCIMCSRCVRFTREVTGTNELGIFGRGSSEQIDVFPGQPLNNPLSGNVIDICPVGALLDKDFLMSMRVWNLTRTASIDGLTASGDNISIQTNEGKIYRIKPRTNMEVNKWWTTDEIRFGWHFVHDEARLHQPMHQSANHAGPEAIGWTQAYAQVLKLMRTATADATHGTLGVMVSPMLASEEAYLLAKLVASIDPDATFAVGPIPHSGEDQTFPGGYTLRAEKAPNARGVRRALELVADDVLDYDGFLGACGVGTGVSDLKTLLLTGNYPSDWITDSLLDAIKGKQTILIDTLPNRLTQKVDVLLPGATWAEKEGTFENAEGRIQAFEAAIPVVEMAKPEGVIALDLMHAAGVGSKSSRYDLRSLHREMGDRFAEDVHYPPAELQKVSDVEYVEL